MDELFYSNDALNVMNEFYDCTKIVYVEGDDDVVFWELVLSKFSIVNVKAVPTGGRIELSKYEEILETSNVDYIIAKDADYLHIIGGENRLKQTIVTPGHSIENSLICPETIKKCIQNSGRISAREININDIRQWLISFCEAFKELLLLDIGNEATSLGLHVMGSNCSQFMSDENPDNPCNIKIDRKKSSIIKTAARSGLNYEQTLVEKGIELPDCIRGHFIFSGVLSYINKQISEKGNKKNISNQHLFSSLISNFENIFTEEHRHYNIYRTQVERAFVVEQQ